MECGGRKLVFWFFEKLLLLNVRVNIRQSTLIPLKDKYE